MKTRMNTRLHAGWAMAKGSYWDTNATRSELLLQQPLLK